MLGVEKTCEVITLPAQKVFCCQDFFKRKSYSLLAFSLRLGLYLSTEMVLFPWNFYRYLQIFFYSFFFSKFYSPYEVKVDSGYT